MIISRFHYVLALGVLLSGLLSESASAQVDLTPAQLFPPDDSAWTLSGIGVTGTVAFKMLAEQTDAGAVNSLLFDVTKNGFPGPIGTTTDDITIFSGADTVGKFATVSVPVGANLSLFHDITNATGVYLSGPDGILDVEDAYLNSDPSRNRTRAGSHQLIKYFGADQFTTYQFTSFGNTVFLGKGYVAFIFVEEDHSPNFDYNDMIIGILPPCLGDSNCDDGLFCNGVEHCSFPNVALNSGVCMGGTPPVCSDGVACTFDECLERPGGHICLFKPHDQDCDDHNFCNGEESCDPVLGCVPGKPVNCDDGIDCTVDTCIDKGLCVHTPDDSLCSDGAFCNGAEICHRKKGCLPGTPPTCDDGISCTEDHCDPGQNRCVSTAIGNCDDGQFCNGVETCDPAGGGCLPGTPPSCDDGIPCTVDSCDPASNACKHVPDSALCNNNQFCDGVESCNPLTGCVPGTPPNCADSVACTIDRCDEDTDSCRHEPESSLCNDSIFCNGVEVCDLVNGCQSGPAPNCSDNIPCTVDSCNPQTDTCQHVPDNSLCGNGLFCDGNETCNPQTGCVPGASPNCDDGIPCTMDSCDETGHACLHQPNSAFCNDGVFCNGVERCDAVFGCQPGTSVDCSDGVGCTVDVCDEVNDRCVSTPDSSLCDDGAFCNGVEVCDPVHGCQDGPDPVCNDGIACTRDRCNPQLNDCEYTPDDSLCADGLFCNGVEVCDPELGCIPGTPPDCDDDVACTADDCDESTDQCVHLPQGFVCDDGVFCNGLETCTPTGCLPGTNPCPAGKPCDEEGNGCPSCLSDGDCVPNSFCQGTGDCVDGTCVFTPPSCDDQIPCTNDRCNPATNACEHTPDNSLCNDGQFCNGTEACSPQTGCIPGTPVNCNDNVACTTDQCNETTDQCTHTPNNNFCNDGQFCNGTEMCHPTQGCLPGTPVNCNDGINCTADSCNEATDTCVHTCSTPKITCTNQQFECDNVGTFLPPVVNDPCSVNPVATCTDVTTPGKLPQEYTVTRTCSFTNDCGNSATCTQEIKVRDTTPPHVICPPDRRFECDAIGDPGQPIVTDNCNPNPIVHVTTETIQGDCTPNTAGISPPPKLIKLNTYTVSDGSALFADGATADGNTTGNEATCTQRIEIIDTHGPTFLYCPASVPGCVGQPLVFIPPDCNDSCGACSTVCTRSDGLPMGDPVPPGPLSIHCVSKDECENSSAPCDISVDTGSCEDIPAVSQWGLVILALFLLIAAKLRFPRFAGATT